MFYLLGLGNPGDQYNHTPHNIGKELVEQFYHDHALDFTDLRTEKKRQASVADGQVDGQPLQVIIPTAFMNNSGACVAGTDYEDKERVIVVHDDIDLPFGKIRISFGRGDGGHNGIKDIVKVLKTKDFIRVRVGVCPLTFLGSARKPQGGQAVNRYLVNKKLSKKYMMQYPALAKQLGEIVQTTVSDGPEVAMNQFNGDN